MRSGKQRDSSATPLDQITAKFRPLNGYVLARVEDGWDRQTPGGIFIPDNARGRPKHAVVLAVAADATELRTGDRIVFNPLKVARVLSDDPSSNADGTPLAGHGDAFIIREDHVLARYVKEGPSRSQAISAIEVLEAYCDANGGSHAEHVAAIRKALWV